MLSEKYQQLSSQNSGYFECQLPVINESEKAICFNAYKGHLDHIKNVWIPKSQCVIIDCGKDVGIRYFVKNWLYTKL